MKNKWTIRILGALIILVVLFTMLVDKSQKTISFMYADF